MAENHEIVELGNADHNGNGTVSHAEPAWNGATSQIEPMERSAASSSSEYFSTRIERLMQTRAEYATTLGYEIAASKDHWSELLPTSGQVSSGQEDEGVLLTNAEIVESLQRQFPQTGNFFWDWSDDLEVGEKIAEGAQAEIFLATNSLHEGNYVLKVFKEGFSVSDLRKQWPLGMLNQSLKYGQKHGHYWASGCSRIISGTVVMNGRFAFQMFRCWGDLRKLIDQRMEHNNNQCPPFSDDELEKNMTQIADGMRALHGDNIIHKDLKASNVLIRIYGQSYQREYIDQEYIDREYSYGSCGAEVADYECSVGVVGTGFWRAPEILQGVKDRKITPDLFTQKYDVYSYAMTCYELITGRLPLEGVQKNEYDVVLRGNRPILPEQTKPWIKTLLNRCWHPIPGQRLDFNEIVKYIQDHGELRYSTGCW